MSGGENNANNNNNNGKFKVIGCRITEQELQKAITPVMHDCYQLGLINHPTVSSFVRFCVNFWMAHYIGPKEVVDNIRRLVNAAKISIFLQSSQRRFIVLL